MAHIKTKSFRKIPEKVLKILETMTRSDISSRLEGLK